MMKKEINYGEKVLKFIKSLPQVKGKWFCSKLEIEYKFSKWRIDFDTFGKNWTELDVGSVVQYRLYDHTDLNSNLKEIYTVIEANKEDIIKAFTVDNSFKIVDLKEQISELEMSIIRLNNELKQLENENN